MQVLSVYKGKEGDKLHNQVFYSTKLPPTKPQLILYLRGRAIPKQIILLQS